MEQQNQAILTTELSEQIAACAFSKTDLKALCERLQEWGNKASEEEIKHYNPFDRTPEQIVADINSLKEVFTIKVSVQGVDNESVYGTIPAVFNYPHFPDKVKSLYINSESELRNRNNWMPRNHFELLLDFKKPELFNFSLSPSGSPLNASKITVSGLDSTWVNGVNSEVTNFIKKKESRR